MGDQATEVFDRIRAIEPLIVSSRAEAERLGRLPDAVAAAFLEQDLYRVVLPRDLGGAGVDPLAFFQLCIDLGSYDGSVGWNFAVASTGVSLMGMLPLERLESLFSVPDCAIAGSLMPSGRAKKVEGGWRLGGRWSWMSGVHQSPWVMLSAIVVEDGRPLMTPAGTPEVRQFVLPKDPACVVAGSWDVGGMRGTGSGDYACDGAIAEEAMWVKAFSGQSNHADPIFRLPATYFGLGLVGVALGIAQHAVDGLKQLAATKMSPRGDLRDQSEAQYAVAKAEALVRSSGMFVRESFGAIWDAVRADLPVTLDMRARARGGYIHAVESAQEAVRLCYRAAGGSALWVNGPFERSLRDVFAIGCHVGFQRATMEETGRIEFGFEPRGPMF